VGGTYSEISSKISALMLVIRGPAFGLGRMSLN
jgi:hypothetical protein